LLQLCTNKFYFAFAFLLLCVWHRHCGLEKGGPYRPRTWAAGLLPWRSSAIKRIFEDDSGISNNQLLWTRLLQAGAGFGVSAEGLSDPAGRGPWIISLIYGTVNRTMRVMRRSLLVAV
jgi:hypothetical protein